ncbi:MAG: RHS repeat-associated core domain-containing protein [Janthinobacterium lividum]
MPIDSSALLICDRQNSPLCNMNAVACSPIAYTSYGWRTPATPAPMLGFNGQLLERLMDGYHLGHGYRMYNPVLMRFHSSDRLSPFDKGGLNTYVYCLGDPVNNADPTGQSIARFARLIDVAGDFASHAENITAGLLHLRPKGVLGYAALASDTGYLSMASGAALGLAGYSAAGEVMGTVGMTLVGLGNGIRSAHGAVQALKRSRVTQTIRRRFQTPSVSEDLLNDVVVVPSRGVLYPIPGLSTSRGVGSSSTPTMTPPFEKSRQLRRLI